jgi:prolipoprotein diacylglyceryltransferase
MGLVLFAVMWKLRTRPSLNKFPGQLTLLFLAFYAVERFIMEIFRNGATAPLAFGLSWLTRAQLTSVLGIVAIAILWWVLSRRTAPSVPFASPRSNVSTG